MCCCVVLLLFNRVITVPGVFQTDYEKLILQSTFIDFSKIHAAFRKCEPSAGVYGKNANPKAFFGILKDYWTFLEGPFAGQLAC